MLIEAAVAQSLPEALQPVAEDLVALLDAALAGRLAPDELQRAIAADAAMPLVLRCLAGKTITLTQPRPAQIVFSPGAQTGDVTIAGDVVGGSKIVLTVNVFYPGSGDPPDPAPASDQLLTCPYPGLPSFGEEDEGVFFGRVAVVGKMLDRLVTQRVVIVVGPSGSGKTSVVLAGLLPKLRASSRFGQGVWHIAPPVRLRDQPLGALAVVFGDLAAPTEAVERVCAARGATRMLLIVDALEELFTQTREDLWPQVERTLRELLRSPRLYLVVTARADYYHRLITGLPLFWEKFQDCLVTLASLNVGGMAQAIAGPATRRGVQVETSLVATLVSEALGDRREAAVLPFLQETLVQLWDARDGGPLTAAAYELLGEQASGRSGLQLALVNHATSAMASLRVSGDTQMSEQRLALARRVLLRLLQFADDGRVLRRHQQFEQLLADGDSPAALEVVLSQLSDQRLLSIEVDVAMGCRLVDLVHEALITGWPDLKGWITTFGDAERTRRRLEGQAQAWVDADRAPEGLLGQVALSGAQSWLASPEAGVVGHSTLLSAYLVASHEALRPPWDWRGVALIGGAAAGGASLLALLALLGSARMLPVTLALALGLGLVAAALVVLWLAALVQGRHALGRHLARIVGVRASAGLAAGALIVGAVLAWVGVGVPVAQREWSCTRAGYSHAATGQQSVAILQDGEIPPFYATIVHDILRSYAVIVVFVHRDDYEGCATFFTRRLRFVVSSQGDRTTFSALLEPSADTRLETSQVGSEPLLQCQPFVDFGQAIATALGVRPAGHDVLGAGERFQEKCAAVDLNNEGYQDYRSGHADVALAKFDRAIALMPGLSAAYNNRALVRLDRREYALAEQDFHTAALILRHPLFLVGRGVACRYLEDYSCVEASFQGAITLDPTFLFAYVNLGAYYSDQGRLDEAKAQFEQAAALIKLKSPGEKGTGSFILDKNLAILHYLQGRFELAREELDRLEQTRTAFTDLKDVLGSDYQEEILFYRAAAYQRLGKPFACELWSRYRVLPSSGILGEAERQRKAAALEAQLHNAGVCR